MKNWKTVNSITQLYKNPHHTTCGKRKQRHSAVTLSFMVTIQSRIMDKHEKEKKLTSCDAEMFYIFIFFYKNWHCRV